MSSRRVLILGLGFLLVAVFSGWASAQTETTAPGLVLTSDNVHFDKISTQTSPSDIYREPFHSDHLGIAHPRRAKHLRVRRNSRNARSSAHWKLMWNHRNWEEKHHRLWRRVSRENL